MVIPLYSGFEISASGTSLIASIKGSRMPLELAALLSMKVSSEGFITALELYLEGSGVSVISA